MMRRWLDRRGAALLPWLLPAALLILWEASSLAGLLGSQVLPAPSAVLTAAWQLGSSGQLLHHVVISTERALAGLLVGGSIGLAFGFLNGLSPAAARVSDTTLQMLRNVPHLALIPLVILWFGIDESAKLFLVALGVFFPIYLNTYHGVRTVDNDLVEMGRAYGLNGWQFFRQVILPGAFPSILVGLRYALGLMWLTLIVAETISSSSGIGYMTMNAREFLQTDVVVLGIVIYAMLGKLADSATRWLERRCLSWHPSFQVVRVAT
jgi:sulfonate transport system permease protein